jgi:hypothetical protein
MKVGPEKFGTPPPQKFLECAPNIAYACWLFINLKLKTLEIDHIDKVNKRKIRYKNNHLRSFDKWNSTQKCNKSRIKVCFYFYFSIPFLLVSMLCKRYCNNYVCVHYFEQLDVQFVLNFVIGSAVSQLLCNVTLATVDQ